MRSILVVAIVAATAATMCFPRLASADSVSPPPGVDLCAEYRICAPPIIIEVELGGKGTDTWTDVIELHVVNQPYWFWFADGTSLPPGSIWMAFLWPDGQIGLSTPLTWRDKPVPLTHPMDVPEPSTLALTCLSLGAAMLLKQRM